MKIENFVKKLCGLQMSLLYLLILGVIALVVQIYYGSVLVNILVTFLMMILILVLLLFSFRFKGAVVAVLFSLINLISMLGLLVNLTSENGYITIGYILLIVGLVSSYIFASSKQSLTFTVCNGLTFSLLALITNSITPVLIVILAVFMGLTKMINELYNNSQKRLIELINEHNTTKIKINETELKYNQLLDFTRSETVLTYVGIVEKPPKKDKGSGYRILWIKTDKGDEIGVRYDFEFLTFVGDKVKAVGSPRCVRVNNTLPSYVFVAYCLNKES